MITPEPSQPDTGDICGSGRVTWRMITGRTSGMPVPITLARVVGIQTPYEAGHVLVSCGGRHREVGGRG